MASIRKRGDRWHVQVRRKGHTPVCRAFSTRKDAEVWSRDIERQLDRGESPAMRAASPESTIGELLQRYANEVSPSKRGAEVEQIRLRAIARQSLGRHQASQLSTALLAQWRDERLKDVAAGTFLREVGLVRRALSVSKHEWGFTVALEAFDFLSKPRAPAGIVKRLTPRAEAYLIAAAGEMHNVLLRPAIIIGLETGMRRGEIVALQWEDIDFGVGMIRVRTAKNGHGRLIPLTPRCRTVLSEQFNSGQPRPIPCSGSALHQSFEHARDRARRALERAIASTRDMDAPRDVDSLTGLRFHDLRHEAISRFFEAGLNVIEAAELSGHRTLAMLKRYAHADVRSIALKLNAS